MCIETMRHGTLLVVLLCIGQSPHRHHQTGYSGHNLLRSGTCLQRGRLCISHCSTDCPPSLVLFIQPISSSLILLLGMYKLIGLLSRIALRQTHWSISDNAKWSELISISRSEKNLSKFGSTNRFAMYAISVRLRNSFVALALTCKKLLRNLPVRRSVSLSRASLKDVQSRESWLPPGTPWKNFFRLLRSARISGWSYPLRVNQFLDRENFPSPTLFMAGVSTM